MATRLNTHSHANYIAGDDDQSIYEWAGADTQSFIKLQGKSRVLSKSYRIPRDVYTLSCTILGRIKNRREKQYNPRDNTSGEVRYLPSLFDIPINKESWLLMARNNSYIPYYEEFIKQLGIPFISNQTTNEMEEMIAAIKAWKELSVGGMVNAKKIKIMYSFMRQVERVKSGGKKKIIAEDDSLLLDLRRLRRDYGLLCSDEPWDYVLDKINDKDQAYLRSIYNHPDFYNPKITISTIHGAKGGEADNVAIIKDMQFLTWKNYQDYPDQENRVWYVGITRAKENLFLIEPETKYYYDI
jgi:DNA helicase-2/ATP-dependent DNA helicase PcrA